MSFKEVPINQSCAFSNAADLESRLSVAKYNEEVIGDPHNYQFYFNKIQVVGNLNFEEDHKKIYSGLNTSHVKPSNTHNLNFKDEQYTGEPRKDSKVSGITGDTKATFENRDKSDKFINGLNGLNGLTTLSGSSPYILPKEVADNSSSMKINNLVEGSNSSNSRVNTNNQQNVSTNLKESKKNSDEKDMLILNGNDVFEKENCKEKSQIKKEKQIKCCIVY